jgi:8-oxoguanine deaminase
MSTLLLRNAALVVCMDERRRQIADGGVFVRDNVIEAVGPMPELPTTADQVINATDHVVLPGLINTHHHLYQTLTRAVPVARDNELFTWLKTLYPIWAEMTSEAAYTSAVVGLAELMLSGCTTAADHLYVYPNDVRLDDTIQAANELGIRFHPTRGSMSLGESKGGLPPDRCVEDEDAILRDCQRVVEQYHDPAPYSMCRVGIAPCSPFSVTPELMRQARALAASLGVRLHTHLAETRDEEAFCQETFGRRPVEYVAELGWTGDDVWYAHGIFVNDAEIGLLARTGTGVAHCPTSNMILGSGVFPMSKMRTAGVKVGLGVDGSASNDGNHLLGEARQAMLLQRVVHGPQALTAEQALELATVGGARVLGRDDIGSLAPGKAADFIAINLNRVEYAGALHDPLAAVVFCAPQKVDLSVINGRVVIEEGQLLTVDLEPIVERHNRLSREMIES